ncbi:MAG: cupin domain-containing protein [Nostoc indistinguendum CM1-VF10]|jgi:quercetin dioxygenase-like cupin family protein|nr:cupin domain-containing protein [Nostoc indistinguendum CM1-VF10]
MRVKQVIFGLFLVLVLVVGIKQISLAQTPAKQFTPAPTTALNVRTSDIPKVSLLEGEILTATLAPGEVSVWHTHASPVFAYTVSGSYAVDFQSGESSITVPAGKAIMEPINAVVRARNLSTEEPASLVLFQVRKPGTAFLDPVKN